VVHGDVRLRAEVRGGVVRLDVGVGHHHADGRGGGQRRGRGRGGGGRGRRGSGPAGADGRDGDQRLAGRCLARVVDGAVGREGVECEAVDTVAVDGAGHVEI